MGIPQQPSYAAMQSAYRQWLLAEAQHETASGCKRLSAIRGSLFVYFQEVVRGWPVERVASLLRSRIKRLKRPDLDALDLTPEETAVADEFVWPLHMYSTPGRPQELLTYPSGGTLLVDRDKRAIKELEDRIGHREFTVNRPNLKRKALAALRPLLGKPFNLNGEHLFWTRVSGFTVETDIDMAGSTMGPLQYWHTVYWADVDISNRRGADHLPRMSISDLLDGGAGITTWDCLTDGEVDSAVTLLVQLVGRFLQAMPSIVEAAGEHGPGSHVNLDGSS